MNFIQTYSSDVAFTASVKAFQARKGSRRSYQRLEESGSWQSRITPELAGFIEAQTSIFLATANSVGQPYIQHRGGPPGFLRVLDDKTIGLVDFAGNRQYVRARNSHRKLQGSPISDQLRAAKASEDLGSSALRRK